MNGNYPIPSQFLGMLPEIPPFPAMPYSPIAPQPSVPAPQIIQNRMGSGMPTYSPLQASPMGGSIVYGAPISPVISTQISEHPCGGKGGSSCGCGGGCTDGTDKSYKNSNLKNFSLYPPLFFRNLSSNEALIEIDMTPMPFAYNLAKAIKDEDNNILVLLSSTTSSKEKKYFFSDNGEQGWIFDNIYDGKRHSIPKQATLYDFAMAAWITTYVYELNVKKFEMLNLEDKQIKQPQSNVKQGTIQVSEGKDEYGNPCVTHNLICDVVGNKMFVNFLFCTIYVDILPCCQKHDINLWCGFNPDDYEDLIRGVSGVYTDINAEVATCIAGKILINTTRDMPWYCGGALTGLIMGIIGALITEVLGFLGTMIASPKGGELFPKDGRNNESCLCGGTKPTKKCEGDDDFCQNLCTKFGKRQDCTECGWKCTYKTNDKGESVFDKMEEISSSTEANCCPGTDPREEVYIDPNDPSKGKRPKCPDIFDTSGDSKKWLCPTCAGCTKYCNIKIDNTKPRINLKPQTYSCYDVKRFGNQDLLLPCCNSKIGYDYWSLFSTNNACNEQTPECPHPHRSGKPMGRK